MWVFKTTADNGVAADFSNVLQAGIFGNVASSWVFPADSGDPDTRTLDITNLTDASGNNLTGNQNILFGAFGTGTTPATGKPAFNLLQVVPEPTSAFLLLSGITLVCFRRRR